MKTYQDFQKIKAENDNKKVLSFVLSAIEEYKNSDMYEMAVLADEYDRHQNRTMVQFQKFLYTLSGSVVPDNISANYKMTNNFFHRFVNQQNQFLLGNGVSWNNASTQKKLGKDFDTVLQKLGKIAIVQGVAYGFWNYDHLEAFEAKSFVPLFDEVTGALMAGIRFWRVDDTKPLRATLYEIEGATEMIWSYGEDKGNYILDNGEVTDTPNTQSYKNNYRTTEIDGIQFVDGENYPSLPIVPLWANENKQSEFVGMQEQIDCYDLIKSGFANDLDDASQIYWILHNAGGMDDKDIALFLQRLKTIHVAQVEGDGATAEAHTLDVPYDARNQLLDRIEKDLYKDFMALNPETIANGAVTATQIKAAYEPLNTKSIQYEYQVIDFLNGILELAGIDGEEPSFTRSMIVNAQEEINSVLASAQYLPEDYIVGKLLDFLGDGDKKEKILKQLDEDEMDRFGSIKKTQEVPAPQDGESSTEGQQSEVAPTE